MSLSSSMIRVALTSTGLLAAVLSMGTKGCAAVRRIAVRSTV